MFGTILSELTESVTNVMTMTHSIPSSLTSLWALTVTVSYCSVLSNEYNKLCPSFRLPTAISFLHYKVMYSVPNSRYLVSIFQDIKNNQKVPFNQQS